MDYKLDNNDSVMIKLDSCFQTFSNHIHVRCNKSLSNSDVSTVPCLCIDKTLFSLHLQNLMAENRL